MLQQVNILSIEDDLLTSNKQRESPRDNRYVFNFDFVENSNKGLQKIQQKKYDVVIIDQRSIQDELCFLERAKIIDPNAFVILINCCANLDNVIKALEVGAYGYISKPYTDYELNTLLIRALRLKKFRTGV